MIFYSLIILLNYTIFHKMLKKNKNHDFIYSAIFIYVCMYVCMYIYMYVCMYVCMYMHIKIYY